MYNVVWKHVNYRLHDGMGPEPSLPLYYASIVSKNICKTSHNRIQTCDEKRGEHTAVDGLKRYSMGDTIVNYGMATLIALILALLCSFLALHLENGSELIIIVLVSMGCGAFVGTIAEHTYMLRSIRSSTATNQDQSVTPSSEEVRTGAPKLK